MNLRKRKRKTAQALDALAGVTKLWSEWQIGKRAAKGVAKAKKVRSPSRLKRLLSSKPVKLGGAAAVVAGAGAAVAKKLKGGGPEPIYTPPPRGEPVAPPDVAPPLTVAPEPTTVTGATSPQGEREPAAGEAALSGNGDGAADAGGEPSADPETVGDESVASTLGPDDAPADGPVVDSD